MSRRVVVFVALTVIAAGALETFAIRLGGGPVWQQVAFFWLLHSIAFATSVEVPVSGLFAVKEESTQTLTLSPGFVVLLTAAFSLRPSSAIAVALIPAIPVVGRRLSADPVKLVFNTAQEAVFVGSATLCFAWLKASLDGLGGLFVAAVVAATLAELVNTALVAGVVSIERGIRLGEMARRMVWTIPHSLGFALAALLVSTVYEEFGPIAAVFLFMPLVAARVVRQAKIELDAAHERTLRALARAVDVKDRYTSRHSERVAEIVVALHRELGTSERVLSRRYYGALLHDVGKVAVSGRILGKTSRLTEEEIRLIQTHPTVGAEVVEGVDCLRDLREEVAHHHERFDGRGYPARLMAYEIPFEARVLAVADTFEALTSDRPYRNALDTSEAIAEIVRCAGTQFDPAPVDALRRLLARGATFVRLAKRERLLGDQGTQDRVVSRTS